MSAFAFSEMRFWSPMRGCDVLRIGAWGADGRERHAIVDVDVPGKERRRRRALTIEQLERAVNIAPPGEVEINLEETELG